ncbi:MAG: transcriptional regulator [Nitrospinae bacterium RIFCSPLOWO2_02_FULL_39_110]|nr:MAG: transcriptional regulator [Nitrospinae bacterium RIFCSPHIGHO2_12_FULL_39_42]OGV99854.1 MAG: transcriptional regulator [Nitrospinae bacterium RIFCSPHIGHO2_02_FULL_39_82]OGW02886.1 MAG: transcriptional regulator [Nitrospinae bacterium RIFCSPLOWO2_02_39_17]OGW05881.1 MAG: transcriptional regulator [Nitrospinae bacterium RIFCSPLOWO2_02_FULL_39_110]OGW11361.1 MAG: transcriptional regulator [Nitrospinae bacterium RIFCSPLOWO2_12_39_15]OGW11425.1 MAG: transcriptional regulator [Nitrospinae bac
MKTTKELLGGRIKELRRLRRLSQEELSEKVEIDPKHLSRIEVGRGFPSLDTLEKMANALNVELKDFFEFAHETSDPKELKRVLDGIVREVDKEKLKLLVKVARAMAR